MFRRTCRSIALHRRGTHTPICDPADAWLAAGYRVETASTRTHSPMSCRVSSHRRRVLFPGRVARFFVGL